MLFNGKPVAGNRVGQVSPHPTATPLSSNPSKPAAKFSDTFSFLLVIVSNWKEPYILLPAKRVLSDGGATKGRESASAQLLGG